jgi:hypothetical protein
MATKNLETVSGLVEQINAKRTGIKVAGEWLNISQYHALAELPTPGQHVDVQVEKTDRGAWINAIDVLDGGQVHQLPMQQRRAGGGRSPAELRGESTAYVLEGRGRVWRQSARGEVLRRARDCRAFRRLGRAARRTERRRVARLTVLTRRPDGRGL